ncbi:ABC transporter ATP-binding protein [Aquabacterium sp.]|uniref:ABC transporter ATP-binding protein n=1 Tax=Aquabacterium sp. TaxID=1872578 RepID=UPI002C304BC3|nr:ABC transporter ATP-binding protein [Aquabacterium sp.]HSW06139.1 ABC transporter ATP-binding protein [Aquabacterium sp.]
MTGPCVLRLRGVALSFGRVEVLRGVNLDVHAGVRHLLLGPNGAGKTTLFNTINGHLRPSAGTIEFDGSDVTRLSTGQRARRGLGRTFQIASLFPQLTVWDNLLIAAQAPSLLKKGARAANADAAAALERSGLAAQRNMIVGNLAYGQQRLLEIAMALATKPRMLLLDEPMAGLTQEERGTFAERVVELSTHTAILLIEHDLEVALRIAEHVTVLSLGAVVFDGKPADALSAPIVKEIYLG